MSPRRFRLELAKEDMKFSAGHFTIFSATERERLHGHNFQVQVNLEAHLQDNGMGFDYGLYKQRIRELCARWDEYFILPTRSPYLQLEADETYIYAIFNGERLPFLKSDVLLLPITNATVEEFSHLLLQELTQNQDELDAWKIDALTVKVSSGPGQCGASDWRRQP